MISRVLEEGLASSVTDAYAQPYEDTIRIIELREFARAKDLIDRAKSDGDLPRTPMVELVMEILGEQVMEERRRRGGTKP